MKFQTEITLTRHCSIFEAKAGFQLLDKYLSSNLSNITPYLDMPNSRMPTNILHALKNIGLKQAMEYIGLGHARYYKPFWPMRKQLVFRSISNDTSLIFNLSDIVSVSFVIKEYSPLFSDIRDTLISTNSMLELLDIWDSAVHSNENNFTICSRLNNFGVTAQRYALLSRRFARSLESHVGSSSSIILGTILEDIRLMMSVQSHVHLVNSINNDEILAAYKITKDLTDSNSISRLELYDLYFDVQNR